MYLMGVIIPSAWAISTCSSAESPVPVNSSPLHGYPGLRRQYAILLAECDT